MNKIKIKMVSLFSGAGMQERGVENTDCFELERVGSCDNDINAIIAYAAIHCDLTPELIATYPDYPSRQEMVDTLVAKNIGYDFVKDKAYNWQKLVNSADTKNQLKTIWLADKLSKNMGDITKVDELPQCGLVTWSFPCTDLSISGKQIGMNEGESRSGLAWEVLRILKNMKVKNQLPNFLLMENVDALVSKKFINDYENLNKEFAELGYDCKYQILNGKFCGVPQNRKRVFGLYALRDKVDLSKFEFPLPFDKGIRLKDVLEDEVDEKYYINNERTRELIKNLVETKAELMESIFNEKPE